MGDFWAFLLQTLTASGAAVLLLIVKAMFRDKLSPRWQFAVWSILALVLLIPAGLWGRYALLNWPMWVEALKTLFTGSYTLTRVIAPIPLPSLAVPATVFDWLYLIYVLGVLFLLGRYLFSYIRLRLVLKTGRPVSPETAGRIQSAAEGYHLPACRGVEVEGLGSAFVCGIFSPVLALPAGKTVDDKVLLHELLHLKYRDVVWGILICVLRCVHWCNPLLWYCANEAGNDLESLCDQRVLERLEGEDRREYGQILLSMANERYARTPGTSSASNGGKNIRRRIQAIVRFKRYPAGMALVSVCAALMLAAPLVFGSRAVSVYNEGGRLSGRADIDLSLASARTTWCTTMAGALDAYGKSLLVQSGAYRAMCAPMEQQSEIARIMRDRQEEGLWPTWDTGLPIEPDRSEGYYIQSGARRVGRLPGPSGGEAQRGARRAVEREYDVFGIPTGACSEGREPLGSHGAGRGPDRSGPGGLHALGRGGAALLCLLGHSGKLPGGGTLPEDLCGGQHPAEYQQHQLVFRTFYFL